MSRLDVDSLFAELKNDMLPRELFEKWKWDADDDELDDVHRNEIERWMDPKHFFSHENTDNDTQARYAGENGARVLKQDIQSILARVDVGAVDPGLILRSIPKGDEDERLDDGVWDWLVKHRWAKYSAGFVGIDLNELQSGVPDYEDDDWVALGVTDTNDDTMVDAAVRDAIINKIKETWGDPS
jgi:hypothetical protein